MKDAVRVRDVANSHKAVVQRVWIGMTAGKDRHLFRSRFLAVSGDINMILRLL